MAENLLEALKTNPDVALRIQEAREFTRSEKKRLAMLMREKQLGQMGMKTNEKGQVNVNLCYIKFIINKFYLFKLHITPYMKIYLWF